MTPDERQMITGLFDRLRQQGVVDKDRDAEALIRDLIRQNPDAAYMLVQTNLVQDMVLQQSEERVRELEDQIAELENRRPQSQPQGSGSFLGGLFGGGSRPSAVPSTGRGQSAGFGASRAPAAGGSPWGSAPGARSTVGGAPMQQSPMAAQAAGGGGFMRSAMATAAGVAGGMLAANAISSMLKGDQAHASPAGSQNHSEADDGNDAGGTYDAHSDDDNDASYGAGDDDFAEDSSSWDE
jgi:hypothetical protein